MELRKDPITRSWVVTGDDVPALVAEGACRFCPDSPVPAHVIFSAAAAGQPGWSARAVVHPTPVYQVEGDPGRRGDGLYDRMRSVGAHEVLTENSRHDRQLWQASDGEIEAFLRVAAERIQDLKRDSRIKYVSVYKDCGESAGQEFAHPTSQIAATMFIPRRVLYELRSAREYFQSKERCVFCDIVQQEERQATRVIEGRGDYLSLCPYAPRVPYEAWILPRTHEALFERTALRPTPLSDLAAMLRRTLQRVRSVSEQFHLVLHTSPNSQHPSRSIGYWKTLDDDYHWHIEILPVVASKARPYTLKDVYYSPVSPETAVKHLREARIDG
jgi:UDPglucose--hexose-1-phosphate uridylyltransferase